MEFDRNFREFGTWLGDELVPDRASVSGSPVGGYVTFDTSVNQIVQMKVGLSYVSIANAEANLQSRESWLGFQRGTRMPPARAGTPCLNRIQVEGGSEKELTKFYTALYHVFENPNIASDVNGEYMGFDDEVHASEHPVYQNYSGWDIIRSWTHLLATIAPEAPDIIASMVQDGVEGGLLPFWSHENVETQVMVGDPGTVNVANAYAMGVRGFDAEAALQLMKKSADDPNDTQRWGLSDWLNLHYVGNAAISLEYAMADFALSRYALALGDSTDAQRYLQAFGLLAQQLECEGWFHRTARRRHEHGRGRSANLRGSDLRSRCPQVRSGASESGQRQRNVQRSRGAREGHQRKLGWRHQ